jgi:beta-barrel assembly-enhancing protease
MRRKLHSRISAAVLVIALSSPQWAFARYNPKPASPNFFSVEQEVQAGKDAQTEVAKQMPILQDAQLNAYIQRLGARLASKAPGTQYPYNFHIVNQKEINAFALPGGPVYVNLGTIQAADNEAQLAGVMAHEISHIVMRHSTHQASQQMMAQLPLAVLGGMLGNGIGGQLARLGISFGAGSLFMKYSRAAESQADLIGADIMHDAGYNPQAMADFFRKLEEQGGPGGPQFLSDHPNPGNRAQAVNAEIRTLQPVSYQQDSAEFRQVKSKVGGMRALTAQEIKQGQGKTTDSGSTGTVGDIRPSSTMKSLQHSAFTVQYPDNWQAYGDQNSAVTIAPQGGVSQDSVAYGVMINGYQPENAGSVDTATHELVAQLRQSNPDMRQVGQDESVRVAGLPGKTVTLMGRSPLQQNGQALQERDTLVAVQRQDGTLLYLVFVAPDQDYRSLQPTFDKMLRSLRVK